MGLFTKALGGDHGSHRLAGLVRSRSHAAVIARTTGGQYTGNYGYAIPDMDVDQSQQAYERVLMVFRCIDAIAKAQMKVPIVLKRGGEDGVIIEDTRLDKLFNHRWSPEETALAGRYRLTGQLLLSRRGAFIEMVRNRYNEVIELRLLPPGQTEPIKCSKHFIDGYKVRASDFVEYELKPKDVIWIKVAPHPTDPYSQMTPLLAARLAIDTDWLSRMFNRNFLINDGRPGMLIAIKGHMNEEDAAEVKQRFQGGYTRAGLSTVVEADDIAVQDLASSPRDIQWAEAVKGSNEDIRLAFGVAESILGNASGRTFANADAEMEGFYKQTVTDHCLPIAAAFDELTTNLDDDIRPYFDWSKVEELQRALNAKREKATADYEGGRITLDEWREQSGYDKFDFPYSRVIIHPTFGTVAGKSDDDVQAVSELPSIAQPKQPDQGQDQFGQDTSYAAYQVDDGGNGQPALGSGSTDYSAALTTILRAIETKAAMPGPKVIRGEIES